MRARTVAIDCGLSRCVVGVFGRTAAGRLCLERLASFEMAAGGTVPWAEIACLADPRDDVAVMPPANRTLVKHVRVPALGKRQRARVIRFEAEQALPRLLAESTWGWTSAGGPEPGLIELAAMRREAAETLAADAERAGLRVESIMARASALSAALELCHPNTRRPLVLVECDGDIALLVRGGGAEPAVRVVGLPTAAPVPVGAAVAGRDDDRGAGGLRLRRLAVEVRGMLGGPGPAETEAPLVLLAGLAPPDPESFARAVAEARLDVEFLAPLRNVDLGPGAENAEDLAGQLGGLVGLAQAAGAPSRANLLPAGRRRENGFRRRRARWIVAAVLATAAIWGAALLLRLGVAAGREERAALELGLEPWRRSQRQVAELRRRIDAGRNELAVLEGLERARTSWGSFLQATEKRLAEVGGIWLETVQLESPEMRTAGPAWFGRVAAARPADGIVRPRLVVTGCAIDPGLDGRRALDRVRRLLQEWPEDGVVVAVGSERFETSGTGLLRFGCVLVLDPEARL